MNGTSGKSSPYASSDGPDSLDALSEDLFKPETGLRDESSSNDVEACGIEQKAISGLDVALSEDYVGADKQKVSSECFDTASESNCMQSELCATQDQTALLATDLDALPDGGFDDIVAMEAEGDSQFEQTMAMLRDLSGSEVCPAIVSCVDDMPVEVQHAAKTEIALHQTSTNECNKNGIREDDGLPLKTSTLPVNEQKVDAALPVSSSAGSKQKGSSGFFNRCIENLLQRGRETAAHSVSPGQADTNDQQNESGNSTAPDALSTTSSSTKMSTSTRSHRKSRKPTKLSHMRLSEDVIIALAKTPLPFRCENCTYTCNNSSELNLHSSVCNIDVDLSDKFSGFTCTYCKARFHSLEDLRSHLSQHLGDHTFHCFFCQYCDHCSDSMDSMDDHVTVHHSTEVSRYEVSLEKVAYLQNMLECPVCGGAFLWKSIFVQHCRSDHHLEDLAAYLESTFTDSSVPTNCKVFRQLFEGFADILQTDSVAEDNVSGEMMELNSEVNSYGSGTVKRFKCDQCSFSADNWELWDRHVQEHHEVAGSNFLQTEEGWSCSAPLVIDEDESLPDVSASCIPDSQSQRMFPLGSGRTAVETENGLESSSAFVADSLKKEGNGAMFPAGMEPELIPANPGSGELPQLTKIGSGRKGVKLRCRLCPFECYRTPNFRRHLAIHVHQAEYPESYRCAYCKFQHRRLNCIRFHLGKYHGQLPAKLSRVVSGKVVEVINADDVNLHGTKYGRTLPVLANSYAPITSAAYSSASLPINVAEDYAMNKKVEMSTTPNSIHEIPVDDQSQSGSASSPREKRLCKPPKRLSDSSDFQPPGGSISHWRMRRVPSGGMESENAAFARMTAQSRGLGGRPFDDNIAEDYILSDLPPGMIYPEPIKCPRCSFTNRVRINLVRHMKQHHTEDQQQQISRTSVLSASTVPSSEPSWMENVPAWARSQPAGHTSVSTQSAVKNAPMKTLKNNVAGSTFVSKTFRYPPKLPNRLGSLMGADVRFTHGYLSSGRLEWNRETSFQPRDTAAEVKPSSANGNQTGSQLLMGKVGGLSTREPSVKRLFKCAYCAVSSRWNRRDISLHVLHVHVRRRAFRCRRCGYGTSKSAAAVTVHCARTHPGRPAIIEDNLTVLNAILPLHTRPGVVLVAFRRPNGIPVMDLDELEEYFGLSKISTESTEDKNREEATQSFESFQPEESMLQYPGGAPLDLSAQLHKETTVSQSVFPTPYRDVQSRDMSQVHRPSTFNSQRRHSESSEKVLQPDPAVTSSNVDRNRGGLAGTKDVRQDAAPQRASTVANPAKDVTQLPSGTAFYRCKLCGYQDSRHDKTKYHVVREHLHLGPYGCAYCPRYMWGRRHVARHIAAVHPTMPVQIRRAFDEFETYLRENIRKIGGQPSRFPASSSSRKSSQSALGTSTVATSVHHEPTPALSTIESLLQSGGQSTEQVKRKATFQCGHCDYRDALAARVQGHCLAKHPSKPVRYRRCDDDDSPDATGALADVKIESVESLAFGQDFFSSTDTPKSVHSSHLPDVRPHTQRADSSVDGRGSAVGDGGRMDSGLAPFMCRYCPESAWTENLIRSHLAAAHADKPPQFGVVQDCSASSADNTSDLLADDDDDDDDDEEDDEDAAKYAEHETDVSKSPAGGAGPVVYRCRMCHYRSDKVTVVKHHVMSHLFYHPYRCPYCDAARSVKSSPINKHVRLRHPGQQPNFVYQRDEELERQVRHNYYRSEQNEADDGLPPPPPISRRTIRLAAAAAAVSAVTLSRSEPTTPNNLDQSAAEKSGRRPTKRILYRCKFCRLKTYVRTDMRHHLMREIGYKPYRCGHCYAAAGRQGSGYSEPSRSAMGKHFRLRHAGMTIDVHDLSDPVRDAEIVQLLDDCAVDEEQDELNSANATPVSGGCIKRSSLRSVAPSKQPRLSKDGETATPSAPAPSTGASKSRETLAKGAEYSKQQQMQKKGKIKSMRLRRCPHCTYSSPSTKALAQHVAVRHRPHRLRCGYCDHMSHYPSWLRKHSRKSHPDLPFNFITMEAPPAPDENAGNTPPDDDERGNFPADTEVIPQDTASSSPEPEEIPDEQNHLTMDQTESTITPPASTDTADQNSQTLDAASDVQTTPNSPSDKVVVDSSEKLVLDPSSDGLLRCAACNYETSSRAQYKMHAMKHRPRKWQCLHCGLNFTLLLQLRQHSFMKHRGKSPKWLDTTTGKVCGDDSAQPSPSSSTLTTATLPTSTTESSESAVLKNEDVVSRKPTARKSTARSAIRVAMFRCGDFFSIRQCTAVDEGSPATSGTSAEVSVDSGISQSESAGQISQCPLLCCHVCNFVCRSLTSFADHLRSCHNETVSPRIEILDDPTIASRCGFCSYETFSDQEFSDHVSAVHRMSPPLVCSTCDRFASFEVSEIRRHFADSHPGISAHHEALTASYSMCTDIQQASMSRDYVARDASSTLNPLVDVTDITDMSEVEFSNLLDEHAVWFDY